MFKPKKREQNTNEVSGVTYFKLNSRYNGDVTKNCGLTGNEIDSNFYFLRGYDIQDAIIENNHLVLKRLNGEEINIDLTEYLQTMITNILREKIVGIENEITVNYNEETDKIEIGLFHHDFVDLGLPSGTLWATENIKNKNGENLYFAWGEISGYTAEQVGNEEGKRPFTWEDYQWGNPLSGTLVTDTLLEDGVLKSDYDAATQNWGDEWRMPTTEEFNELFKEENENLYRGWDSERHGFVVSATNGNELFFPAVGGADDGEVYDVGEYGCNWSASLGDVVPHAFGISFNFFECWIFGDKRFRGCSVRPVLS